MRNKHKHECNIGDNFKMNELKMNTLSDLKYFLKILHKLSFTPVRNRKRPLNVFKL